MDDDKLIEVRLTYESGCVQLLSGDEADKWLKDVDNCIMVSTIHHNPIGTHPWKELDDNE